MKRKHFAVDDMYNFAVNVLEKGDYPREYAETTAFALLGADRRGIFSHGIAGGTGLEESVKRSGAAGTVNPKAIPETLKTRYPTTVVINANGAPGHYTSSEAVKIVKEIARKYGIGKVIVNNGNHFGAAGVWSEEISKEGDLVGIVNCTTAACAKPMGDDPEGLDYTKGAGTKLRTGTNPESISIPHKNGVITLDMAYTRMAASYCIKCVKGKTLMTIPGYGADANYKSTLDPEQVYQIVDDKLITVGSIFPLGSEGAGYKGDNKLRMIELSHAFGGGPLKVIPLGIESADRRISHEFVAYPIDYLYTKDEAIQRVSEIIKDYKDNYFGSSSRWPGDRAHACMKYAEEEGIPYSEGQVNTLRRSAEHVGLNFDKIVKEVSEKEYPAEFFKK